MAYIEPLRLEAVPELALMMRQMKERLGFVPNSLLIMAHRPEIVRAFVPLAAAVMGPGTVSPQLKQLVAYIASTAAGCRYCQAHTAATTAHLDMPAEKLEAAWQFETADRFSAGEKAALRLARDASVVPNAVTAEHFDALRNHFGAPEIVELVAVISLFGWLNRWNDTLATPLEDEPLFFAQTHLGSFGWTAGKHATK